MCVLSSIWARATLGSEEARAPRGRPAERHPTHVLGAHHPSERRGEWAKGERGAQRPGAGPLVNEGYGSCRASQEPGFLSLLNTRKNMIQLFFFLICQIFTEHLPPVCQGLACGTGCQKRLAPRAVVASAVMGQVGPPSAQAPLATGPRGCLPGARLQGCLGQLVGLPGCSVNRGPPWYAAVTLVRLADWPYLPPREGHG